MIWVLCLAEERYNLSGFLSPPDQQIHRKVLLSFHMQQYLSTSKCFAHINSSEMRSIMKLLCFWFFLYHAVIIHINPLPRGPIEIRALLRTDRIKKPASIQMSSQSTKEAMGGKGKRDTGKYALCQSAEACGAQVFWVWDRRAMLWFHRLLLMSKLVRKPASHFVSSSKQA